MLLAKQMLPLFFTPGGKTISIASCDAMCIWFVGLNYCCELVKLFY